MVKSNLYFANPQLQVAPVYCTSWLEKPSAHHPKPPKQEDHQITNPKTTPILGKSHLSKLLKCYRTFTWFDHPLKYGQFHQRKRKSRSSLPTATHHSCYTNATSARGQGLGDVPAQRESALWNVLLYRVSGGCVSFFCGQPFLFKFADGVQLCRHTIFESFDFSYIFGGVWNPVSIPRFCLLKIAPVTYNFEITALWDNLKNNKKLGKKSRPSMRSNYSPFNTFSTYKNSAEEKLCWGWLPTPPALHGILPQSPLALSTHGLLDVENF